MILIHKLHIHMCNIYNKICVHIYVQIMCALPPVHISMCRVSFMMCLCEGRRLEALQKGNAHIFIHVYTCIPVHIIYVHIHILDEFDDVCVRAGLTR